MLAAVPGAAERDYSSLRSIAYGASPITTPVLRAALRTFRCPLFGVYGLTETTGGVVQLRPEDHDADGPRQHLLRSAGNPLPWVEMRIVDPVSGGECGAGDVGEVWLRAPNVMAGYYDRPAETAAALMPDGWLRTGDGGYRDEEGYLFLTDRIKDMIVSGGENIYPIEVEEVLAQHPAVVDVAVIGVPDERWGEAVKALVVLAPGLGCRRRRAGRVRSRAARRLQAAALGRVRRRASAQPRREGAQARAARPVRRRPEPRSRPRVREQEADQLAGSLPGTSVGRRGPPLASGMNRAPRDAVGQPPAVVGRQDPVLLTVDDERRRCDLGRAAPRRRGPGRQQAGGHRRGDRAAAEPPGDVLADQRRVAAEVVAAYRYGTDAHSPSSAGRLSRRPRKSRIAGPAGRRARRRQWTTEDERANTLRVQDRQLLGDRAAERQADDVRLLGAAVVEERHRVLGCASPRASAAGQDLEVRLELAAAPESRPQR